MEKLSDFILPPKTFSYSPWRHGGWYTNVRYPSGASGCVSNNYEDRKWRIACDPRPFEERPTFSNRHEAAMAEWHLVEGLKVNRLKETNAVLLEALEGMKRIHGNCGASPLEQEICAKMDAAIAKGRGEDGGDMADPEQLSADGYCAAAAPFMLNTLNDIASLDLEDIPDLTREQILAWVQMRANEAIAKATGGTHA